MSDSAQLTALAPPGDLSVDSSPEYLISQGLITAADVVGGGLRISGSVRRHDHLRLERRDRSGWLIKFGRQKSAVEVGTEARFYSFCHENPVTFELASYLARPRGIGQGVLAVELLADSSLLFESWQQLSAKEFTAGCHTELGQALAVLHSTFRRPELLDDPRLTWLESPSRLSILSLHRPAPELLARATPAKLRLIQALQADPVFGERLEALAGAWTTETVIHGDVRSANILVLEGGSPAIRLVDWEFAQFGDPAWDVGCALAEYIHFWLLGMPLDPELEAGRRMGEAKVPLAPIQQAIRSFWKAYRRTVEPLDQAGLGLLRRAIRLAAARWTQLAWEYSTGEQLSTLAVLLIQTAANLLAEPERLAAELLGLDGLDDS